MMFILGAPFYLTDPVIFIILKTLSLKPGDYSLKGGKLLKIGNSVAKVFHEGNLFKKVTMIKTDKVISIVKL